MDQVAQPTPGATSTEVGLIIKNELLEQEKRITQQFGADIRALSASVTSQLNDQGKTYMNELLSHEGRITTNTNDIKALKTKVWVVGTVCTTLGGLLGFFVAQLVGR